jgi:CRISPR type IV-associated protein Csf3
MEPLRIEFHLDGAVIPPSHPIHLDSLVAGEILRAAGVETISQPKIDKILDGLPFARLDFHGASVWAASSIAFRWTGPTFRMAGTRRIAVEDIADNVDRIVGAKTSTKIETARGKWKSAQWATSLQQADLGVAFAIGSRSTLEDALARLESIGAARRYLSAVVLGVTITPDERALELAKRRYLPAGAIDGLPHIEGAIKMPLYDKRNRTIVADNHLEYADV